MEYEIGEIVLLESSNVLAIGQIAWIDQDKHRLGVIFRKGRGIESIRDGIVVKATFENIARIISPLLQKQLANFEQEKEKKLQHILTLNNQKSLQATEIADMEQDVVEELEKKIEQIKAQLKALPDISLLVKF